jgi:cytoskeletal protein CcmA (bactofilin family)
MRITKKGKVYASVRADALVVEGFLQGDAVSLTSLRIAKGAKVVGNVRAASLVLEPGATLVGAVRVGPGEVPEVASLLAAEAEAAAAPGAPGGSRVGSGG